MLRSMIVGLAIAALLQLGAKGVTPEEGVVLAADHIAHRADWAAVQAEAVDRLICQAYTLIAR